jgi:hypothetical protein
MQSKSGTGVSGGTGVSDTDADADADVVLVEPRGAAMPSTIPASSPARHEAFVLKLSRSHRRRDDGVEGDDGGGGGGGSGPSYETSNLSLIFPSLKSKSNITNCPTLRRDDVPTKPKLLRLSLKSQTISV